MVKKASIKTVITNSHSGKVRKEYNDDQFIREDYKEVADLYDDLTGEPISSFGITLSEFSFKNTGKLHHGFVIIRKLGGQQIRYHTLKEMILKSSVLRKARDDSAELMAVLAERGKKNYYEPHILEDKEDCDEWVLGMCKRTPRAIFSGEYETSNQFIKVNKTTNFVTFNKPLYLNNFLSITGLKLPEPEIEEENIEFYFVDVK